MTFKYVNEVAYYRKGTIRYLKAFNYNTIETKLADQLLQTIKQKSYQ